MSDRPDPYAPPSPEQSARTDPRVRTGDGRRPGHGEPAAGRPGDHRDPSGPRSSGGARSIERGAPRAVLVAVCGLVAAGLLWPLGALGVVLSAAALWMALQVRARSRRSGRPAPGGRLALVVASGALVITVVVTAVSLAFGDQITRYRDCLSGANTQTAKAACEQQLRDDVNGLPGLAPGTP